VLAARSVTPSSSTSSCAGIIGDYRVLTARDAGGDKEQALLDIVQRMCPTALRLRRGELHRRVATGVFDGATLRPSAWVWDTGSAGPGASVQPRVRRPVSLRPFFFRARCFDPFFFDPSSWRPVSSSIRSSFPHRFFFFPRVFVFSRT